MVQFLCQCLNVCIGTKGPVTSNKPVVVLTDEFSEDSFFTGDFSEFSLNVNDIIEKVTFLLKKRVVSDWIVFTCVNCNTPTHAVHSAKGLERVLVNSKLLVDDNKLKLLKDSSNLSPIFNIIIKNMVDLDIPVMMLCNPAVKAATESITQQVSRYLKDQHAEMDRRIKQFVEEQHKAYAVTRDRSNRDKEVLETLVAEVAQQNLEQSLQNAAEDMADLSLKGNKMSNNFDTSTVHTISSSLSSSSNNAFMSTTTSDFKPLKSSVFDRTLSVPTSQVDDLFDMEGVDFKQCDEADSSPYFHSDDDIDTDESSFTDESYMSNSNHAVRNSVNNFATSLPISVHGWNRSRHSSEEDELAKTQAPADPKEMAASIKALARSVQCTDGTEMFGELPGHKMNTADIALSRLSTFKKT